MFISFTSIQGHDNDVIIFPGTSISSVCERYVDDINYLIIPGGSIGAFAAAFKQAAVFARRRRCDVSLHLLPQLYHHTAPPTKNPTPADMRWTVS